MIYLRQSSTYPPRDCAVHIVKRTTILLIDDDPAHLTLYSKGLSYAGFRPIVALVGSQGVSFPDHESPDLVLLDYQFSSLITPQQATRLIRDRYPHALLILLSSRPVLPADM